MRRLALQVDATYTGSAPSLSRNHAGLRRAQYFLGSSIFRRNGSWQFAPEARMKVAGGKQSEGAHPPDRASDQPRPGGAHEVRPSVHAPRRGAGTFWLSDRWLRLSRWPSLPTGYLHWTRRGRDSGTGWSIPPKTAENLFL